MKQLRETQPLKPIEVWQQDTQDSTLWHGDKGVMLNDVALKAREDYFDILRVSLPHILNRRKQPYRMSLLQ